MNGLRKTDFFTDDAKRAIRISKYPPLGARSVSMPLPQYQMAKVGLPQVTDEVNKRGSTVFIMIETISSLTNVDEIAALPGCDVLLVGCQDLCMELGIPGDLDNEALWHALDKIGNACKKHGRILAVAGIHTRPDLLERVIKEHGARWIYGGQDLAILQSGAAENVSLLNRFQPDS